MNFRRGGTGLRWSWAPIGKLRDHPSISRVEEKCFRAQPDLFNGKAHFKSYGIFLRKTSFQAFFIHRLFARSQGNAGYFLKAKDFKIACPVSVYFPAAACSHVKVMI